LNSKQQPPRLSKGLFLFVYFYTQRFFTNTDVKDGYTSYILNMKTETQRAGNEMEKYTVAEQNLYHSIGVASDLVYKMRRRSLVNQDQDPVQKIYESLLDVQYCAYKLSSIKHTDESFNLASSTALNEIKDLIENYESDNNVFYLYGLLQDIFNRYLRTSLGG
jgi:hypothetical protein